MERNCYIGIIYREESSVNFSHRSSFIRQRLFLTRVIILPEHEQFRLRSNFHVEIIVPYPRQRRNERDTIRKVTTLLVELFWKIVKVQREVSL